MLQRLISRINSAHVIATIALFAALGGGYAMAFSGSGTVQKGALKNIPSSSTVVRSLTGIGSIKASCTGEPSDPVIVFQNSSGENLDFFGQSIDDGPILGVDIGQGDFTVDASVAGLNHITAHISPVDGSKRPQADIQISANDAGFCVDSYVEVLATNTEE